MKDCVLDRSARDDIFPCNDCRYCFLLIDDATVVLLLLAKTSRVTAKRAEAAKAVSGWHASGTTRGIANRSIDERVAFLEKSMGGKTLEEHFREHAELIDRRFAEVHARFTEIHGRFTAQDKRFEAIDRRFEAVDARFVSIDAQFVAVHARFEAMDERFNRVDHELGFIRRDLGLILQKLNA